MKTRAGCFESQWVAQNSTLPDRSLRVRAAPRGFSALHQCSYREGIRRITEPISSGVVRVYESGLAELEAALLAGRAEPREERGFSTIGGTSTS